MCSRCMPLLEDNWASRDKFPCPWIRIGGVPMAAQFPCEDFSTVLLHLANLISSKPTLTGSTAFTAA